MNIIESLKKEHSKANTIQIATYIGNNENRFKELVEIITGSNTLLAQRASWVMAHCTDKHPLLITTHIERLVKSFNRKKLHPAIIRNTFRSLQFVPIPKKVQGLVVNTAFEYLNDRAQPAAIKVFAMTVLANMCEFYPELSRELITTLQQEIEHESAGYRSRAKQVLKKLKT